MDDVVAGSRRLIDLSVQQYKEALTTHCMQNLNDNERETFKNVIASVAFCNPFDGLHSAYLRNKTLRKNMPMVQPKEIKLGETVVLRKKGLKRQFVAKDECFMYVP